MKFYHKINSYIGNQRVNGDKLVHSYLYFKASSTVTIDDEMYDDIENCFEATSNNINKESEKNQSIQTRLNPNNTF